MVRENRTWKLNDPQRLVVAALIVVAVFLTAMSLGMGSYVLGLVALGLLISAGLIVFLLGLRYSGRQQVRALAYVITASTPPAGKIVGKCEVRLLVDVPGGSSVIVRYRDPAVPITRWPRVGAPLPVILDPRNPSQLRVVWSADDSFFASIRAAAPMSPAMPPTTPLPDDPAPAPRSEGRITPVYQSGQPLSSLGLDPEFGYDPTAEVHTGPIPATPPAGLPPPPPPPAQAQAKDADAQAQASAYELPVRNIPQPRPAEPIPVESQPPALSADGEHGMGIMLIVSDVERSLHFYRDLLGFTVAENTPGSTVLNYGGSRLLLRAVADMSPVDRPVANLHVRVPDIDAAYADLKAKGVEFGHKPRVINNGKPALWAAPFRDPDGHSLSLTEWRDREDAKR